MGTRRHLYPRALRRSRLWLRRGVDGEVAVGAEVTSGRARDPAGQSLHGQAPGSPASDVAVGFAFEEAANWRADLHAVRAWNDEVVDTTVGDHGRFTDPESHRGNGAGAAVEATGQMVEQVPGRCRAPDGGAGPIGAGVVGVRGMALIVAVGSRGRGFCAPDCWGPPATR